MGFVGSQGDADDALGLGSDPSHLMGSDMNPQVCQPAMPPVVLPLRQPQPSSVCMTSKKGHFCNEMRCCGEMSNPSEAKRVPVMLGLFKAFSPEGQV